MATTRRYATPKDERKRYPAQREALRRRVYAMTDVCGICGRTVDKTLPAGSPLSPELDEIIPISRGGSAYDIDNLQLTHRICNRRKGAKMPGDDHPENINPTPNSRAW